MSGDPRVSLAPQMVEAYQCALRARCLPTWLAFIGQGGEEHARYAETAGYQRTCWALREERAILSTVAGSARVGMGFCDVGSGTGRHAVRLLSGTRLCQVTESYLALDANPWLAEQAKSNVSAACGLRTMSGSWNFELTATDLIRMWRQSIGRDAMVVLGLLGVTIGGSPNHHDVLRNLSRSSVPGDHLIITTRSGPATERELRKYNSPSFLRGSLSRLGRLGLDTTVVDMEVVIEGNAFVGYFRLRRPMELLGVRLDRAESIQFFYSARLAESAFLEMAARAGWECCRRAYSANGILVALLVASSR